MAKRKIVELEPIVVESDTYGDEGIVTRDRDLTPEEIEEIYEKAKTAGLQDGRLYEGEEPIDKAPSLKGRLKIACGCGAVSTLSEDIIEDGLSWSMIVGNDHFLQLHCQECGADLKMYIEEITDELPEESNKE